MMISTMLKLIGNAVFMIQYSWQTFITMKTLRRDFRMIKILYRSSNISKHNNKF